MSNIGDFPNTDFFSLSYCLSCSENCLGGIICLEVLEMSDLQWPSPTHCTSDNLIGNFLVISKVSSIYSKVMSLQKSLKFVCFSSSVLVVITAFAFDVPTVLELLFLMRVFCAPCIASFRNNLTSTPKPTYLVLMSHNLSLWCLTPTRPPLSVDAGIGWLFWWCCVLVDTGD